MIEIKTKLWVGLGAFVIATGAANAGLAQDAGGHGAHMNHMMSGQGGEGGEGGEQGMAADAATDDVAYLSQLGLVRGHLHVGVALYLEGHRDAGRTHMKHPQDELYATLLPAFDARNVSGFDKELERVAELTAKDASDSEVKAAYEQLVAAITRTEQQGAPAAFEDPVKLIQVAANLLRTAAEEYDIGTEDRVVVNAHEYQDSLGFTRTAKMLIDRVADRIAKQSPETLANVEQQFEKVQIAWQGVMPPERVDADPALLHNAAANLDFAAASLR